MSGILCKFLGHRRSKRDARAFGETWRSYCKGCGIRLERSSPGNWHPVRGIEHFFDMGRGMPEKLPSPPPVPSVSLPSISILDGRFRHSDLRARTWRTSRTDRGWLRSPNGPQIITPKSNPR